MTDALLLPLARDTDAEAFRTRQIDWALDAASEAVRDYCHWHIANVVSEIMVLDGTGGRHLWLPTQRVVEVASIVNDGVTLAEEDYRWSRSGYVDLKRGRWSREPRGVEITLSHGFDRVPAHVGALVVQVALRAVSSPSGITHEQALSQSVQYALVAPGVSGGLALLEHEKAILERYRVVRF